MGRLGTFLHKRGIWQTIGPSVRLLRIGRLGIGYWNADREPVAKVGNLSYLCNICGCVCETRVGELERESVSCLSCGSTMRFRAIIHVLSLELFGESLALPDFPSRPDIKGLGLTDWDGYAVPLAQKLAYENTYYHREPQLDITDPKPSLEGTLDFLIASDVFEHIPPPTSRGFQGAYRLLKPGGLFVLTVPYDSGSETREHFPLLHEYKIVKVGKDRFLRNTTREGEEQIFEDLSFHDGAGSSLEMRVFSERALRAEFEDAGFSKVRTADKPCWEFGIYWSTSHSLPIVARK